MRALLTNRIISVSAEDRLSDVSRQIAAKSASHCVVREQPRGEYLGVVRVRDALSSSSHRIFADLISEVPAYRVARNFPRSSILDMVRRDQVEDAVVLSPTGKFIGLVTPESLRDWQLAEHRRTEQARQARTASTQGIVAKLEKKLEQQTQALKAALSQLDDFSYAVSHDVRAPLRTMRGYAVALQEDYGPCLDETAQTYVQRIIRASHRLDRLTMGVIAYREISQAQVALRRTALGPLVEQIVRLKRRQAPTAEFLVLRPLATVRADRHLIALCVTHLLDNALKFVVAGRTVSIRIWTEKDATGVRLWIEDNGLGIRPKDRERIFQLFGQVHPEDAFDGIGVGLTIVRRAAEKTGVSVGVEAAPAGGSRFWLRFER